jgi:hypothetical protein
MSTPDTTTTTTTPDFVATVPQNFYIEPLGGAQNPLGNLDRFPDALYNKALDSNLMSLLYALLGPAGVGSIQYQYLIARLSVEAAGLNSSQLSGLYANPLSFVPLIEEQSSLDQSGLLTSAEQTLIDQQDASFKNRVIDFLHAVRAGGTVQGISLAAKSGLGYPVEVIENYKALYDHFSDNPLGLHQYGTTQSTEEAIIIPDSDISQSEVQTIYFFSVQGGTFTITYPVGNNNTTSALPYNTTYDVIQGALAAISSIGTGNVIVSGGPLPDQPIQVQFTGLLANQDVPTLQINSSLTTSLFVPVSFVVETSNAGLIADGETVILNPNDTYYMYQALSDIQPVTSIITTNAGQGTTLRQPANTIASDSTLSGVYRYVTGSNSVSWPSSSIDPTYWIQPGVEHEAPRAMGDINGNYQGYHNIANILAYTEAALSDPLYGDTISPLLETGASQWPTIDNDVHIGPFSAYQGLLYPFIGVYNTQVAQGLVSPSQIFYAAQAEALQPEPLTITSITGANDLMINGIYPVAYQGLPGVPQPPAQSSFWSSLERTTGVDYLEIDLGTVQAVNFLYFEATSKPYTISVEYDLLDQSPSRTFYPVTLVPNATAISTVSLSYSASNTNPWTVVKIYFSNALGNQIFTRYLRIGFTKVTGGNSPFIDVNGNLLPYSIEVQNLRIGRNVA